MQLLLTSFAFIALIIAMYWGAAVARRKLGIGAQTVAPGALKVVGKRPLEAGKALYVVKIAERYVLLGAAEGSVNLIDHITADEFTQMTDAAEDGGTRTSVQDSTNSSETTADATESPVQEGPVPANQFLSVSESFHYFLGKARGSRDARSRVAAQVADATADDDARSDRHDDSTT